MTTQSKRTVAFALCGSFCSFAAVLPQLRVLTARGWDVLPVLSASAAGLDTRFGTASALRQTLYEVTGHRPLTTLQAVEPLGPQRLAEALIIAPATGTTMALLAAGISSTPVTLAAKSLLRGGRPIIIAPSTNDGLSGSAPALGQLLQRRSYYFVPFGQDDSYKKPCSLKSDFTLLPDTLEAALRGVQGEVAFRNLAIERLGAQARNEADTLPPVDERTDGVIRFQQRDFPVIDYHVHLKGGLTKERAHAMSMNYGINYGVAPNAGEGGVGRMLADDGEVYAYFDEVERMPFLCGVQGEGRKWTATFSQEALGVFDYLFTDAMTIIDHKGRNSRIYRPEEVHYDGVTKEQYMDHLVDQTVKILTNEPADIYANPTYLPDDMQADYDRYWTDARVDRVLDVLERYGIALEINARYRIPSFGIIRRAKQRGIKFTFGTNNVDADFGRLEYSLEAVEKCGLTADDIWFPAMSVRRGRPVVLYNKFE